jgi:2,4-dichlorophenol 6-monooxygenase
LDLAGAGRFTLLTGIGGQGWLDAAEKLATELDVELVGHRIGPGCDYADVLGDWARVREISDRGCLLVRPDNYVAWRSQEAAEDPVGALRQVLIRVLAR